MKHTVTSAGLFLALISGCKMNRQAPAPPPVPPAPPVAQVADTAGRAPAQPEVYRASNPRTNDIIHTKLEVDFNWNACRMNGKATIQVKPYFYPVSMLYLNARGMDISKVEVFEVASVKEKKKTGGRVTEETVDIWNRVVSSNYKYENDSIKINLGRTFSGNENYFVVIDYVAKPNELKEAGGSNAITEDKGLYFINPTNEQPYKMPQIWTQGETQSSSVWFPTIDSPNERMTQEIYMTVEEKFTTLSNGSLVGSEPAAGGKRTDHWKLEQPHAPYLAMMAVGEFKKVVDEPWNGKEISYYVDKEYEGFAKEIFGNTREMVDFYSIRLGVPFAWPKYAQIVAHDYVSGAMENTSATLHGDFMVYQTSREMVDGKRGEAVIAHELFHQWFGDLVTCESWSNLPLNESFATYGEYLWEEHKNGRGAADAHSWQSRQGYMQTGKEANLIRFNYESQEDMFDAISYNKGGQVLHMLRKAVGDSAFFSGLKLYLETNRFKPVEIHHLRLAMEETSGQDLNWFFNQWFLNKGRPSLKVSVNRNADNVEMKVEQVQDLSKAPLYRLPIYVDVYSGGKVNRVPILINAQQQTFTLATSGEAQLLNFDAERQLLCDLEYKKTPAEYLFQYKNGPLFADRLEALKNLDPNAADEGVYQVYKQAANADAVYQLRMYALSRLQKITAERNQDLKPTLLSIYRADKNTVVRATALEALNARFGEDADVKELNIQALREQSYAICGKALTMLTKHDTKLAMEKAKMFENQPGKDVLYPLAILYAEHGGDDQLPFFHQSMHYFNGFEVMNFCSFYAKNAKRCSDPSNAITAANDFEQLFRFGNKYAKFAAVKSARDLATVWEEKEKALQGQIADARTANTSTAELEKKLKETTDTKELLQRIANRMK